MSHALRKQCKADSSLTDFDTLALKSFNQSLSHLSLISLRCTVGQECVRFCVARGCRSVSEALVALREARQLASHGVGVLI